MTERKKNALTAVDVIARAAALSPRWYMRSTDLVASSLIGKWLATFFESRWTVGEIVETEAYLGVNDLASHSVNGKTKRNASMFETGGACYVYFIYGVHCCVNVVTGGKDKGEAVLIRAVRPLIGLDVMRERRGLPLTGRHDKLLASGPGRFAQAFGFSMAHDGETFLGAHPKIIDPAKLTQSDRDLVQRGCESTPMQKLSAGSKVCSTTRIGITKASDLPLRFYQANSSWLSKPPRD